MGYSPDLKLLLIHVRSIDTHPEDESHLVFYMYILSGTSFVLTVLRFKEKKKRVLVLYKDLSQADSTELINDLFWMKDQMG